MTPLLRKRLLWSGLAAAALVLVIVLWPSGGNEVAAAPRGADTAAVTVAPVLQERLDDQITTTGTLLPWEAVELRAEVAGRITALRFEEGTAVRQGQTLAVIDTRVLDAEREAIQARRELAAVQLSRQQELFSIGGLSRQALDQAESELRVLDAQLSQVRAELSRRVIVAPFSGQVGLREVSVGAYVSPGDRLATLRITNPLRLEFSVPERYLGRVNKGDVLSFRVPGQDAPFTATVYATEPAVDASTRSFTVRARVGNTGGTLKPGSFAEVGLVLATVADALLVPTVSVITGGDSTTVYLLKNGRAQPRAVQTGVRTADMVQITAGLAAGDTVLTSGFDEVRPGQPVRATFSGFDPTAPRSERAQAPQGQYQVARPAATD